MKYVIVLGDGMADYPLSQLDGKTPLQAAEKPNMDGIAARGKCGLLQTVPQGMEPGSDVANLSVLGYDPVKCFTGRGPLEAASMGVALEASDIAMRCNLITEENGRIADYGAGHVTTAEATELIKAVSAELGSEGIRFYPGMSYRHLLVLRGDYSDALRFSPPHNFVGEPIAKHMVEANDGSAQATAELLNRLIIESKKILEEHPVNAKRAREGKRKANMLWFWSAGRKPAMQRFAERFGLSGAMISAVDLLKGIAVYAGFDAVSVQGATGYLDTDYEGKADAALEALKTHDLVYVHVEAPDECSHEGSAEKKIKAIEDLDERLIGRLLRGLGGDYSIAVLPDHYTPIALRTHSREPVPFAIYASSASGGDGASFDEKSIKEKGSLGLLEGDGFIRALLGR
jgi:2,3-bisphosphoglycerate-independent phosphoglycerate mutase